ncbi:MAG: hypothetical protein ACFE85_01905 [Candidatus Hodarchaeota archaeon]
MLLFDNKKARLLNFLKLGINPFKKFVITGEIKEDLSLVKSRKEFLDKIVKVIENEKNFILPIVGEVGIGKTHLFWALKNKLYYHNAFYISLENVIKKFFYNIYSEFIEAIGVEPLRNIVNHICNQWGALERKFGFFHVANIEKVRKIAFNKLSEQYPQDERFALLDIINGITTHQLDLYKKVEAEGWLLAELMNIKELSSLNMRHDLRNSKTAYIMLKLLIENSKLGSVLFIDDFEKAITMTKPVIELETESEEVFDRSWLYGKKSSPDNLLKSKKIFEKLFKLNQINGLRIIIMLNSLNCLGEIKRKLRNIDGEVILNIKEPMIIPKLDENDTHEIYKKNLKVFLESIDFGDYLKQFPNELFPLNEEILHKIFQKSSGNPREIMKLLIKLFNEIIYSSDNLNTILEDFLNSN